MIAERSKDEIENTNCEWSIKIENEEFESIDHDEDYSHKNILLKNIIRNNMEIDTDDKKDKNFEANININNNGKPKVPAIKLIPFSNEALIEENFKNELSIVNNIVESLNISKITNSLDRTLGHSSQISKIIKRDIDNQYLLNRLDKENFKEMYKDIRKQLEDTKKELNANNGKVNYCIVLINIAMIKLKLLESEIESNKEMKVKLESTLENIKREIDPMLKHDEELELI